MVKKLALFAIILTACSSSGGDPRAQLESVTSWCCWLQGPDVDTLAASPYEFVVIDYSRDGSALGEFTPADLQELHDAGKVALAYLSIGEAEDYRFYWAPGAPYLSDENPSWPGNYAVEYWDEAWWQEAVQPYLDRILAQGFDGVYLDRIDAYEWWHTQKGLDLLVSADRMAALVQRIADYARERYGTTFIVCPQNGLSILDDASDDVSRDYVHAIDAVGVESLFYNYASLGDQAYRLSKLAELNALGKRAFVLEYVSSSQWSALFAQAEAAGLVTYPAALDRLLDELIIAP